MAYPAPSQLRLLAAAGLLITQAFGRDAPTASVSEPPPAIFTPAARAGPAANSPAKAETATAVPVSHAISSALSASIATALPRYEVAAASQPAVLDKPRNHIPRLPVVALPKVVVRERKLREFSERESYTEKGLEELAVRRYLSAFDRDFLNRFTLPIIGETNEYRAMRLFDQDEAIKLQREIAGLSQLDAIKDPDLNASPPKAP